MSIFKEKFSAQFFI